jgi:Ribonuclease G/E
VNKGHKLIVIDRASLHSVSPNNTLSLPAKNIYPENTLPKEKVGGHIALVIEDDRLTEVSLEDHHAYLYGIYLGKVQNVLPDIQAYFVEIDKGVNCFLRFSEVQAATPILVNRSYDDHLIVGDEVVVQVTADPIKSKQMSVTTNISIKGRYLVLSIGKSGLGISSKIPKKYRNYLKSGLQAIGIIDEKGQTKPIDGLKSSVGCIVRTQVLSYLSATDTEFPRHLATADIEHSDHLMTAHTELSDYQSSAVIEPSDHLMTVHTELSDYQSFAVIEPSDYLMNASIELSEHPLAADIEHSKHLMTANIEHSERLMTVDIEHSERLMKADIEHSERLMRADIEHSERLMTADIEQSNRFITANIDFSDNPIFTAISSEYQILVERMRQLMHNAGHRTCFSCLQSPPAYFETAIDGLRKGEQWEIVTDLPDLYTELELYLKSHCDQSITARLYQDDILPLAKLYSIDSRLKEALSQKVWLKSGAYLVIEQTEAMTVIDVNTGKAFNKHLQSNKRFTGKHPHDIAYFYQINQEAAKEIALQLRLRNLSGIIIVDFINMEDEALEQKLLHTFKHLVMLDPTKTEVIDITPLGLVEITRKRKGRPLSELLQTIYTH